MAEPATKLREVEGVKQAQEEENLRSKDENLGDKGQVFEIHKSKEEILIEDQEHT